MQTAFTLAQLADPAIAGANDILRKCVHCGFCTATCPTYVLYGDERDSPRGRIYLIKNMLEDGGSQPAAQAAPHIDRCLSCLSCMTTCPSGVDYMHLIDTARVHIEKTAARPAVERLTRLALAKILPSPRLMAGALKMARLARPARRLLALFAALRPLAAMLDLVPARSEKLQDLTGVHAPPGSSKGRVIMLAGCAQQVLRPRINTATIGVLNALGRTVVVPANAGCCGSLAHHMGRENDALARVRATITAWQPELDGTSLEAIIINASGCGTTVKDYGHMMQNQGPLAQSAERIAGLARDICEFIDPAGLSAARPSRPLRVAYHSACSLQHGQKITTRPPALLRAAGFEVLAIPEGHLCCGSAGTYNILHADTAAALRDRKIANIATLEPDVIATGNIGCITQLQGATGIPVVHTIELLHWSLGGPPPPGITAP